MRKDREAEKAKFKVELAKKDEERKEVIAKNIAAYKARKAAEKDRLHKKVVIYIYMYIYIHIYIYTYIHIYIYILVEEVDSHTIYTHRTHTLTHTGTKQGEDDNQEERAQGEDDDQEERGRFKGQNWLLHGVHVPGVQVLHQKRLGQADGEARLCPGVNYICNIYIYYL